ncbi:MAG: nucleotide exchange factor GrpE [Zoogloeaceae bacterium]|jgi:molecular chaperone GrpE|nr:nucleotide exchange factor GrpE [Zoogloeaceae bacterium]
MSEPIETLESVNPEPAQIAAEEVTTVESVAVTDPEARIAELEAKVAELSDNWLRARAEAENTRRRAQEEVSKAHKFGVEKFAGDLLAIKDSLEAALARGEQSVEDLRGGVEVTLKQLAAAFERAAIREVDPAGEKFDPNFHQAIQTVESEQEPNTVAQVLQKGYLIADRVLRPALVIVARAKAAS